MTHPIVIYAADVGSEAKERLAWCRLSSDAPSHQGEGGSLSTLAASLVDDLAARRPVALGFECPLAIDLPEEPRRLTSARDGEGNPAWCAGAGAGALAVGLAQCAWLFERLARAEVLVQPTLAWDELVRGRANLLIWEAFVSNKPAGHTHLGDALLAARAFQAQIAGGNAPGSAIRFTSPYSLAGAALLRAGLSHDVALLRQPCIVVRP